MVKLIREDKMIEYGHQQIINCVNTKCQMFTLHCTMSIDY